MIDLAPEFLQNSPAHYDQIVGIPIESPFIQTLFEEFIKKGGAMGGESPLRKFEHNNNNMIILSIKWTEATKHFIN